MADFKTSLAVILENEGGYVNDPNDRGGETYKGISRRNWPNWEGWAVVDVNKSGANFPANLESSAILQINVETFYRTNFWQKRVDWGFDALDQAIATKVMDMSVNMGALTGVMLLQRALNRGFDFAVKPDGIYGQVTQMAANKVRPDALLAELRAQAALYYFDLVTADDRKRVYLLGWIRRAVR
jgi:lysozyme family protein